MDVVRAFEYGGSYVRRCGDDGLREYITRLT